MAPLFTLLSHLLINPLITVFTTLRSLLIYITPSRIQSRLSNIISVNHQLLNLLIGRALPDLTTHIPTTDLINKTAIITGSNSGIGLQIALELTRRGAFVVLACRSQSRGEAALQHILWNVPDAKGRVSVSKLDTSDLESVKGFAVAWVEFQASRGTGGVEGATKLDILVHNAGIAHAPAGGEVTDDRIETLYATNFVGSFLLTYLLEPYLSGDARVIFTSSTGQLSGKFKDDFSLGPVRGVCEPGFNVRSSRVPVLGWEFWSQGASARDGDRAPLGREERIEAKVNAVTGTDGQEFPVKKKTAHAFTPGFTMTPIFRKFEATSWLNGALRDPAFTLLKAGTVLATDVDQGAATGVWLACTQDREVIHGGGGYWDRMSRAFSVADAMSDKKLQRLWKRWERDTGVEWT